MKKSVTILALIIAFAFVSYAQKKNDAIQKQIKSLKADKSFTLTYDGNSSKIMAVGENFAEPDATRAGIQAMNFGIAVFYSGKELASAIDTFDLAFWVLTKKPKFEASHLWKITLRNETLDIGSARYAAKPRENMEYLNFKITRTDLVRITAEKSAVRFKLGTSEFRFSPGHIILFKNLLAITDPASQ